MVWAMITWKVVVSAAAVAGVGVVGGVWLYRSPRLARALPDRLKARLRQTLEERFEVDQEFFPVYLPAQPAAPVDASANCQTATSSASAAAAPPSRFWRRTVPTGLTVVVAAGLLLTWGLFGTASPPVTGRPTTVVAAVAATSRSTTRTATTFRTPEPILASQILVAVVPIEPAERSHFDHDPDRTSNSIAPASRPSQERQPATTTPKAIAAAPPPAKPVQSLTSRPTPLAALPRPSPRETPKERIKESSEVWFGVQWPDEQRQFAEVVSGLGLRVFVATGQRIEHEVRFDGRRPYSVKPRELGDDIWPVARDLPRSYVEDGTAIGDRVLVLIPVMVNDQWQRFKEQAVRDAGGPAAVSGVVGALTRNSGGGWQLRVADIERRGTKQR